MSALIQGYNLQTCKTHAAGWMALTSFFFNLNFFDLSFSVAI